MTMTSTFAQWLEDRHLVAHRERYIYDTDPLTCGELSCPVWRWVHDSARDEWDAHNAHVYSQQLEAMVHEAAPQIAEFATIGRMFGEGIGTVSAKHFGQMAQELFDETRAQIERAAGIEE